MKTDFELGGKKYSLAREGVEDTLTYVSPKPIDKYFILVRGRPYSTKQVLAAALNVPLGGITTTDSNGILARLGFEVRESSASEDKPRTESEVLFEEYLNANGFIDYEFEKEHRGKSKRPDYSLRIGGEELIFEMKEFRRTPQDCMTGAFVYDPYGPIREKINDARKKFREFKQYCCCLVLYNAQKPLVDLGWQYIYAAMLGNMGFRIPFDPSQGLVTEEPRPAHLWGGSLHGKYDRNGHPLEVVNTTISAILVLERFPIGTNRDFTQSQLRIVVHENPYTGTFGGIPLNEKIFCGPYDERFGPVESHVQRKFVGEEIRRLEEEQNRCQNLARNG